ncbi:putative hydrolase of the HAD superfamily [Dysgonomonas sp. PH5-45]|uniref:HAD family hydrolase n=1 Tax=unclassified Dysgonomonas TaxID=2630389 RepID=UPI0024741368|nr:MULTISPECIES: HAD family hydrolase [unclassified Dysgonomonas]MDH6355755.1 putative hydrolase of the HAD superfamily [Dysgonomonas sp. PH5-45]MDH6388652.1 putative hydrolase of the HAD superfamily [Dysgonomonas sp. PH5-37]
MKNKIELVAFDADDTLWVNETHFYEFEAKFCTLIEKYLPSSQASKYLFETEMKNLHLYGYGVKGMMLCMIELICKVVDAKDSLSCTSEVIRLGQELLQKPIDLLDGAEDVLAKLNKKYKLILVTKGDLLDQERKIELSGLKDYFHHIEIMSNKRCSDYSKLIEQQGCKPDNFLMLGNSLKSDIIPVLELGAYAIHIPYHTTWKHEQCNLKIEHPNFITLGNITETLNYL